MTSGIGQHASTQPIDDLDLTPTPGAEDVTEAAEPSSQDKAKEIAHTVIDGATNSSAKVAKTSSLPSQCVDSSFSTVSKVAKRVVDYCVDNPEKTGAVVTSGYRIVTGKSDTK